MAVVAFDFDGTLLDSRKRHIVVMRDTLKKFGMELNVDDLVEFKRDGKNNIDYLVAKGINADIAQQIQKQWIDCIEQEKYLDLDVLYDDSIKLLNEYSVDNDLILITARANAIGAHSQIKKFNLNKYFKEIFVVMSGKTAVNAKADVLRSNNAVLMIGDTRSDYMASRLAGVKFVFHENGFHNKQTTMGGR